MRVTWADVPKMAIITPVDSPVSTGRAICIPNSPEWKAIISGKLMELTWASSWQQINGMTPEAAAAAAEQILFSWLDETCQCTGGVGVGNSVQIVRVAHTAPYDTPPQQNTPAGYTQIADWCNLIQRDDTGLARVENNVLYLPAGKWAVSGHHIAIFSNDVGFLELFQLGQTGITVRGVDAFSYMNQMIAGDFEITIETGFYLYQYCRIGTTAPYATKALEGNDEIYGQMTFMRIGDAPAVVDPGDPGDPPTWPITIDFTDGSAHGWTVEKGELTASSGVVATINGALSTARLTIFFPDTVITGVTLVGTTGSLTTPGTEEYSYIRGYLDTVQAFLHTKNGWLENTADQTEVWTGSQTLDQIRVQLQGDYPSEMWITQIIIDGEGDIPDELLQA